MQEYRDKGVHEVPVVTTSRCTIPLQNLASISIIATTIFTSSLPAHAEEGGTLQPFACGPSTAEVVDAPSSEFAIGTTGKAIKLVSKAGADCGFVLFDLPEKYYLIDSGFLENNRAPRQFNALKIVLRGDGIDSIKDAVLVRMCFKPQFGLPDLISVDVPLKEFRQENNDFWARRETIFGNRPGATDLRKLSVILTNSGSLTVGGLKWAAEINPQFRRPFTPKTILLQNADCAAGRPCKPAIADILEAKSAPVLERPTRPPRPTR